MATPCAIRPRSRPAVEEPDHRNDVLGTRTQDRQAITQVNPEFNRHALTVHKASFAQALVEIRRNVRKLRTNEVRWAEDQYHRLSALAEDWFIVTSQ
jgi:hypothetical protein